MWIREETLTYHCWKKRSKTNIHLIFIYSPYLNIHLIFIYSPYSPYFYIFTLFKYSPYSNIHLIQIFTLFKYSPYFYIFTLFKYSPYSNIYLIFIYSPYLNIHLIQIFTLFLYIHLIQIFTLVFISAVAVIIVRIDGTLEQPGQVRNLIVCRGEHHVGPGDRVQTRSCHSFSTNRCDPRTTDHPGSMPTLNSRWSSHRDIHLIQMIAQLNQWIFTWMNEWLTLFNWYFIFIYSPYTEIKISFIIKSKQVSIGAATTLARTLPTFGNPTWTRPIL